MKTPGVVGPSDDDLLIAVAIGDRKAFRRLMERHAPAVVAMAHRVTGSAQDGDDVAQEAFLKVWVGASQWRIDGAAKFSSWLYRVVLNLCLDRLRRRRFSPLEDAGDPVDPSPDGADAVSAHEMHAAIAGAMNDLPARQRDAVALYYFSEMNAQKVAEVLGLTLGAVESLLLRARRALKAALERQGIKNVGDAL